MCLLLICLKSMAACFFFLSVRKISVGQRLLMQQMARLQFQSCVLSQDLWFRTVCHKILHVWARPNHPEQLVHGGGKPNLEKRHLNKTNMSSSNKKKKAPSTTGEEGNTYHRTTNRGRLLAFSGQFFFISFPTCWTWGGKVFYEAWFVPLPKGSMDCSRPSSCLL